MTELISWEKKKILFYYEKQHATVKSHTVITDDFSVFLVRNFFFNYFNFSAQQETKQDCLGINVLLLKVQLFKTFAVFDYM